MDPVSVCAVLARTPGLDAAGARALVAAAEGDVGRAIEPAQIARVEITPRARGFLTLPDEAALQADLDWIAASGALVLLCTDPRYPPSLLQIPDPPPILFVLGDARALGHPQLAMVGARNPTPGGRQAAHEFAAAFARAGLTITSGLATGIDAASHEGALSCGGSTVAVCGTGLDQIYPTQHTELAARIRGHGALVSQFPPRTPPRPANFPQRNRLISGLSLGTLVVEAALHSGSLVTARLAHKQGRSVFAVPGSIRNPLSRGCHQLIREGARLVAKPAEALSELAFYSKNTLLEQLVTWSPTPPSPRPALDKEYEMLLDAVDFEPATIDVLVARTGLPGESIASMLLILELEGRVAPYPGGRYGCIP